MAYFNEALKTNSLNEHELFAQYEPIRERVGPEIGHIAATATFELKAVPDQDEAFLTPNGQKEADIQRPLAA